MRQLKTRAQGENPTQGDGHHDLTTPDEVSFSMVPGLPAHNETTDYTGNTGPEHSNDDSKNHPMAKGIIPVHEHSKRYLVEEEIGRGGMGIVFRAVDPKLNRPIAMKIIRSNRQPNGNESEERRIKDRIDRFKREASITGRLDHPGIVPVHELCEDEAGQLFFTMKYVQGKTLSEVFKETWTRKNSNGNQGLRKLYTPVLEALIKVCETLAFAHKNRVIHRDLKPANIMVGEFGETYVMDWGLAKVIEELADVQESSFQNKVRIRLDDTVSDSNTVDGSVVGTPYYMPPEQAIGSLKDLDERSDVYSVGAMLYEILSGKKPYHQCENILEVIQSVSDGPPMPIADLNENAPPELVAIAEKAMAHEKSNRYPDMGKFADDIRAFLRNEVVGAHRTDALAKAQKLISRNFVLFSAVTTLLVIGFIVFAAFQWQHLSALQAKQETLEEQNDELERQKNELEESNRIQKELLASKQRANNLYRGSYLALESENALKQQRDPSLAARLALKAILEHKYDTYDVRSKFYEAAERITPNTVLSDNASYAMLKGSLIGKLANHLGKKLTPNVDEKLLKHGIQLSHKMFSFSPNSKYVASIVEKQKVVVWDVNSLVIVATLPCREEIDRIKFNADGSKLIGCGGFGHVVIWDFLSARIDHQFTIWDSENNERPHLLCLGQTRDDSRILLGTHTGRVFVCDLAGQVAAALDSGSGKPITELRVADGNILAISTDPSILSSWSLETLEPISIPKSIQNLTKLELSADSTLAGGLKDDNGKSVVEIVDLKSGETTSKLRVSGTVAQLKFRPHHSQILLAVQAADRTYSFQLWELKTEKLLFQTKAIPKPESLQVSADGTRLLSVDSEQLLSVWDIFASRNNETKMALNRYLDGHHATSSFKDYQLSADPTKVITASTDNTIRLWDVGATGVVGNPGVGSISPMANFEFNKITRTGDRILLYSPDRTKATLWSWPGLNKLKVIDFGGLAGVPKLDEKNDLFYVNVNRNSLGAWSLKDGEEKFRLPDTGYFFSVHNQAKEERVFLFGRGNLSIWENGERVHSRKDANAPRPYFSEDGRVSIWIDHQSGEVLDFDLETGEESSTGIFDRGDDVAISPDNRLMAISRKDKTHIADIYEISSGKHVLALDPSPGLPHYSISRIYFSEDSSRVMVKYIHAKVRPEHSKAVMIWSMDSETPELQLGDQDSTLFGYTPDWSRLLIWKGGVARLMDGHTGNLVAELPRSFGDFHWCRFSGDGKHFIIQEKKDRFSEESRTWLFRTSDGARMAVLPYEQKSRFMIDIMPDSSAFLSGSLDGQIQVWPIDLSQFESSPYVRRLNPNEMQTYLAHGLDEEETVELDNRITDRERERKAEQSRKQQEEVETLKNSSAYRYAVIDQQLANTLKSSLEKEKIIQLLEPLLDLELSYAELIRLSRFYEESGKTEMAINLLERAARSRKPGYEDGQRLYKMRNSLLPRVLSFQTCQDITLNRHHYDEAKVKEFENQIEKLETRFQNFIKALEHFNNKEFPEAVELLSRTEFGTDEPEPYILHAKCLEQIGKYESAIRLLFDWMQNSKRMDQQIMRSWARISFSKLNKTPRQLLTEMKQLKHAGLSVTKDYQWLLSSLADKQPLLINSGSDTVVHVNNQLWSRDRFYVNGHGFFEDNGVPKWLDTMDNIPDDKLDVPDTNLDVLCYTERWFDSEGEDFKGYRIPVPNGRYRVEAGLCEIYDRSRSFRVTVENEELCDEFDPTTEDIGVLNSIPKTVDVEDGILDIQLSGQEPQISFLSITNISK